MPSDYRFSQGLAVRVLGLFLVGLGAVVAALALVVGLLGLPAVVLTVGVVVAVVAVVVGGLVVLGRGYVVRLDDTGYRVRFVRGAGVARARWKDVEDVAATTVAGVRCVVLRLNDGSTTTVPVAALTGQDDDFVRDLQRHLDRGHGYRRIS